MTVVTGLIARSCYFMCGKEAHNTLKSLDNFKKKIGFLCNFLYFILCIGKQYSEKRSIKFLQAATS